jgi:iron complex transport system permease protein
MTLKLTKFPLFFLGLVIVIAFLSLLQGAYPIEPLNVFKILISRIWTIPKTWTDEQELILLQVRMPRIVLVSLVGTNLAVSGAVLQAIFKNPLVSPFILGISSGASFGASIVITFFVAYSAFELQMSAFVFAVLAVFIVLIIAKKFGNQNILILLLAGIIVSSLFASLVSLIQFFSAEDRLQAILFWTFGSFSNANWMNVVQTLPVTATGCIFIVLESWKINVLSLGDEQAETLGMNAHRFRIILILLVSLMSGTAVAVCGPIGWVGLIIPHIVRMFVGSDNYYVNFSCIGLGAAFLLSMDLLSRIVTDLEIPIGIVTSILGAPFFIFILYRTKRSY